jgi:putative oxidoreductase
MPEVNAMKAPFLAGRLLFGGFFLYSGINHFMRRPMLSQYVGAKGVPAPDVAVTATGAALILGGASLILGMQPKLGVASIAGFLAGVTPIMHDFWRVQDPQQRMNEMVNFTKNMALLGAALALLGAEEPWPASVPVKRRRSFADSGRDIARRLAV